MVIDIFAVHILFSEVASLVLKDLAIHGEYFGEEADLDLFVELVGGVAIDEDAFAGCVGVEIEEAEVLALAVEVGDDFLDGVDGTVGLGGRVDVASVEVDAIGVHPVVPSRHPIRVQNGEQVEHEFVPEQSALLAVLGQLADYARHHVGTGHLPGMHSGTDDDTLLLKSELLGLAPAGE